MIAPTNRLLIIYGATVPPLAILPLLAGLPVMAALAAGAVVVGIMLMDAALARLPMRHVGLSLPAAARMTKGRDSALEISLINTGGKERAVRLGIAFPPEISSPREDASLLLAGGAESFRLPWPCTPLKRGEFTIERCCLEAKSPLGFWAFRSHRKVSCAVRVYPSLARERKNLSGLFLNRGGCGIHARRHHGKGRDFEELRDYIPGDGFDEIHWKATAKRRHPITKVFQIERTQEVYVAVDASRLSGRPAPSEGDAPGRSGHENRMERFIEAALVLGLAAQKQGDLFGIVTFSDSVHDFLRARGGKAHYGACRDRLYNLQPRMVNPSYEALSAFIRLKMRRRSLIMVLTSLDDPVLAESFTRSMEIVSRHHLLMAATPRPPGSRPIFSNVNLRSSKEIYDELSGHALWHDLRELERALAHRGVRLAVLDDARMSVDLVSRYMRAKERQIL
ncbi:MAG TPA: DUF58 domain-containing protein [Thermodesulfobacteriota bacterium]|nr:DUF58 domain-containing protein [Thermodesulfobacteriota bacterium]